MDPLSIAASIAGIANMADLVFSRGFRIVKLIKNADDMIEKVFREVNMLAGLLHSLENIAQQMETSSVTIDPTLQVDQVHACQLTLEKLKGLVGKTELSRPAAGGVPSKDSKLRILKWPLCSSESKELLAEVNTHKQTLSLALNADTMLGLIQSLQKQDQIRETLATSITTEIATVRRGLDQQIFQCKEDKLGKEHRKILSSLAKTNPWVTQASKIRQRQPGTGIWYTNGDQFRDWLTGDRGKLWLYGIPGAGKTILMSSIIEEARKLSDTSNGLAIFYCDYKDTTTHEPANILRSLIKQLVLQNEETWEDLKAFCTKSQDHDRSQRKDDDVEKLEDILSQKTPEDFQNLLFLLSKRFKRVMIIIDGLDEIETNRIDAVQLLHDLNTAGGTIKTLFASRSLQEITRILCDHDSVSIAAQSDDLKLYVSSEIASRTKKQQLMINDAELKEHVIERLIQGAQGMFRWVACQLDYFCTLPNDNEIRQALDTLPPDLFQTYDRILRRITSQSYQTQKVVRRALQWITFAAEPIPLNALLEALAIDVTDTRLDPGKSTNKEYLLRSCSSLLRYDTDTAILELAHFTVKEYLLALDPSRTPDLAAFKMDQVQEERDLAQICLTFLHFDDFMREPPTDLGAPIPETMHDLHPFLMYSAQYWMFHADGHYEDQNIFDLASSLFDPSKKNNFVWWSTTYFFACFGYSIYVYPNGSTLHWAAALSLVDVCAWLLKSGANVNAPSSIGVPLQCAVGGSSSLRMMKSEYLPLLGYTGDTKSKPPTRHAVVELLLQSGANAAFESDNSSSLTSTVSQLIDHASSTMAPEYDEEDISKTIRAMVRAGARIRKEDVVYIQNHCNEMGTLLSAYKEIVYSDADLNIDENAKEALQILRSSQDVAHDSEPLIGDTTGSFVSFAGQKAMIESLKSSVLHGQRDSVVKRTKALKCNLIEGIFKEAVEESLVIAIACQNIEILEVLLGYSPNLDFQDPHGNTLLHLALANRDTCPVAEVVQCLLDRGANFTALNSFGESVFHLAARTNNLSILNRLLSKTEIDDPQLFVRSHNGQTPLWQAIKSAEDPIVCRLLQQYSDKDLSQHNTQSRSCLQYSVRRSTTQVLLWLEQRGMDLHERASDGSTLLHYAAENDRTGTILQYLLERGIDHSLRNGEGLLPIHLLCKNPSEVALEMLEALLRAGSSGSALSAGNMTSLHHLVANERFGGQSTIGMTNLLLSQEDIDINARDSTKSTPLIKCCSNLARIKHTYSWDRQYRGQVITAMVRRGADVMLEDSNGRHALHYMCMGAPCAGMEAAIKLVYLSGAKFNSLDSSGRSSFENLLKIARKLPGDDPHQVPGDFDESGKDSDGVIPEEESLSTDSDMFGFSSEMERVEAWTSWHRLVEFAINTMQSTELELHLSNSQTPLSFAVVGKHWKLAELLLAKNVDVDILDAGSDESAIDRACTAGCTSKTAMALLGKTKRNIDSRTGTGGETLLHRACQSPQSFSMVRQLLCDGADIEVERRSDGMRALAIACSSKLHKIVELLVAHGVQVDARRKGMWGTALHAAAYNNAKQCIKLLLDAGADTEILNSSGQRALISAARFGSWEAAKLIIENGSETYKESDDKHTLLLASEAGNESVIQAVLKAAPESDLEIRSEKIEGTPLLHAAASGSVPSVKVLLEAGAKLGATSKIGNILHHAILATECSNILSFLLSQDVDWDSRGELTIENDSISMIIPDATLVHRAAAARTSNINIMEFLVMHFPNMEMSPVAGPHRITPLHISALKGYQTNTNLLLKSGADAAMVELEHGWTPLHMSAVYGRYWDRVIPLLLQKDCGILTEDKDGHTPAFAASMAGHMDIAKHIQQHIKQNGSTVKQLAPLTSHDPVCGLSGVSEVGQLQIPSSPGEHAARSISKDITDHETFSHRRIWRIPMRGLQDMQNALTGSTTIYGLDTTTCDPELVERLQRGPEPGLVCLDKHVLWQMNWNPCSPQVGGSLDLLLEETAPQSQQILVEESDGLVGGPSHLDPLPSMDTTSAGGLAGSTPVTEQSRTQGQLLRRGSGAGSMTHSIDV